MIKLVSTIRARGFRQERVFIVISGSTCWVLGSNGTENSLKELSGWLIPRQKRFECSVILPQLTDRWLLHAR